MTTQNSTGTHRLAKKSLAAIACMLPLLAQAACPDPQAVAAYVEDYKVRRAHDAFKGMSLEDAQCARRQLIAELPKHVGPVIGYRLLFTRDEVRTMRQFDSPVWGAIFGNAFQSSPAKVPVNFGARIVWEPDLLVEMNGPGLAEARTPMQALRSIAAVIPYIDLKDNMLDAFTYADYVAVNASFRTGVIGQRIAVKPSLKTLRMFRDMEVTAELDDQVITKTRGTMMMDGTPLNGLMWLARELKKEGIVLKKGDLLSVGSFAAGQTPRLGTKVKVSYQGLPGDPAISVAFSDRLEN